MKPPGTSLLQRGTSKRHFSLGEKVKCLSFFPNAGLCTNQAKLPFFLYFFLHTSYFASKL